MALGEWLLRVAVTTKDIGVGLGGRQGEIGGSGYRRFVARPADWVLEAGTARARATYGPFSAPVSFDRILLFDGDELVDTLAQGVTMLPGGDWAQDVVLGAV